MSKKVFKGFNIHLDSKADLKVVSDIMMKIKDTSDSEAVEFFSDEEKDVAADVYNAINEGTSF